MWTFEYAAKMWTFIAAGIPSGSNGPIAQSPGSRFEYTFPALSGGPLFVMVPTNYIITGKTNILPSASSLSILELLAQYFVNIAVGVVLGWCDEPMAILIKYYSNGALEH